MTHPNLVTPMAVLALWTMTVLLIVPFVRVRAARSGQVGVSDFLYGESARVPDWVRLPNRNFMNLLEVPLLFYVAALTAQQMGWSDPWMLRLAWLYVGMRILHSLVHLTYNRVLHRLAVFGLSNLVVVAMWWRLLWFALGL